MEGLRYVMEDPKTVFKYPEDRQVIVYLEWEGPLGRHKFEGLWKDPDDKLSNISNFEFEPSERRFGGYFTLLLSDAVRSGVWTLEVRVDGERTGQHTFQIIAPEPSPPQPGVHPSRPKARVPLTPSQLYQQATAATLLIETLDGKGNRVDAGSGFFISEDMILTGFEVIDGASRLRITFPDGRRLESDQLLAWDRWKDWAFLKISGGDAPRLAWTPDVAWSIGDRVYSLVLSPDGKNRVITQCDITGKNNFDNAGERINLLCTNSTSMAGTPLLNAHGELIGIMGGIVIPGVASTKVLRGVNYDAMALLKTDGLLAVPISVISKPEAAKSPIPLQQLAADGTFVPLLSGFNNLAYGVLAKRVEAKPYPRAVDETSEFSSREGKFAIFLSWDPKEKVKGTSVARIYDLSNRLLVESKPMKIDLKPGAGGGHSMWQSDISGLKPAIYRVDVLLDSTPMWRAFFRVVN